MPDSDSQETLQQFLELVGEYGLEASPINFTTEATRSICPLPYEIRNPDDSMQVIAEGSFAEHYMSVGGHGNYRRMPTKDEMGKLRLISAKAGIRLIEQS